MSSNIPEDIYQPQKQAASSSESRPSVLFLTADKTEDLEFFYPYYRFIEEGFHVEVATPDGGKFEGKQGLGLKDSKKISEVSADNFSMLYIPGGKAPEKLKKEDEALALTRAFVEAGKPVASICHGPQVLAEADVIQGKKIAAWPEVEDELKEAGATFVNQETCTDGQFITARWPADLPAHTAKILQALKQSGTASKKAAA